MIPRVSADGEGDGGKPRASGDDPYRKVFDKADKL